MVSLFLPLVNCNGQSPRQLLATGWQEMIKDNDTTALRYFNLAYELARKQQDTDNMANALLKMGICYYGVSYSKGMQYAQLAMDAYKKLEKSHPLQARQGRSKCIQLISTIQGRQGKYRESIRLSHEAMQGFEKDIDTTTYLGLIYYSLGNSYQKIGLSDSAVYYQQLALKQRLETRDSVYLPGSYIAVADIELRKGNRQKSLDYYQQALKIAEFTKNRQAQVGAWLGLGKWEMHFTQKLFIAESYCHKALAIAAQLSDKSFRVKALAQLMQLKKLSGDYKQALALQEETDSVQDEMRSWEKQHAMQILEVQFDVAEKNRQLELAQKSKKVTQLTNYLLTGFVAVLVVIGGLTILFLRKINKRDRQLLHTKEELVKLTEEQNRLREQQMQNEIEFRESQLSALTLQMVQKNELLQELKDKLQENPASTSDPSINKIIYRGLNQDREWSDFNTYFESINKNFYTRIKQAYPGISPNDLKMCALIKMNLSIKEMATILNISPDSVKTARYRLRKKLQLNTEDNLTEFILQL
ncbi:MAG TPA: hypothetical protein VL098_07355 [Flavipsychrobacter sp.]|nr:hypothetical protein [Flavipsychrobacter sp.]